MKSLLAAVFITTLASAPVYANYNRHHKDVTKTAAPSSDISAAGSEKPNAQEYVDTARTGQAAPVRSIEKDGRCRDADGVWLHKEDIGYNACIKEAKRTGY